MSTPAKQWVVRNESHSQYAGVDCDGRSVCDVQGDGIKERAERARLIAAAPELLEAASRYTLAVHNYKQAMARYGEALGFADMEDKARIKLCAAIAKATGGKK